MRPKLEVYLKELKQAIKPHFQPNGLYYGKDGALRLARELGYGLKPYDPKEVNSILGSLYSTFIVVNCFGRKEGTPLTNKEFVDEVRNSIKN